MLLVMVVVEVVVNMNHNRSMLLMMTMVVYCISVCTFFSHMNMCGESIIYTYTLIQGSFKEHKSLYTYFEK